MKRKPGGGPDPSRFALYGLALVVLGVYGRTLHPSIPGGDSGELIGAAVSSGVPHPPGYPLFTVLGHALSAVPFGAVAARVNLLSALCDTGAACTLFALVWRWRGNAAAAFLAAGLFAFSPGIWGYATVAEVFPLNNLLAALLVYLMLRFHQEGKRRWAYLGALCIGLGVTNHHTIVFIALPAIAFAIWKDPGLVREAGAASRLVGLFVLGFLPYLHLPLAVKRVPSVMWGDPSTLDGFLGHLLRRHVGTLNLGASDSVSGVPLVMQLLFYAKNALIDTCGYGLLLAAAGLALGFGKDPFLRWTAATFAFYTVVFHGLANLPLQHELYQGVEARFWQMPAIFVFGWVGVGFAELLPKDRRAMGLACLLVALQCGLHFREQDQSENRYVERFARWLMAGPAPNSLLVREGDLALFSTWALQACENPRPDVDLEDISSLTYPWRNAWAAIHQPREVIPGYMLQENGPPGTYTVGDFLEANAKVRPVYYLGTASPGNRFPRFVPTLFQRIHLADDPITSREWMRECLALLPPGPVPPYDRYPESTWENQTRIVYGVLRRNLADRLIALAEKENDAELAAAARQLLEEVLTVFAAAPPEFYALMLRAYRMLEKTHPELHARAEEVRKLAEPGNPR